MTWWVTLLAVGFAIFGLVCVALIVIGLPGTWMMLAAAVAIELVADLGLGRAEGSGITIFGWPLLLGATGLAVLGELIEFVSGAVGARMGGATRRGVWGALFGGILGALALTFGLPIPLLGALLGAVVGTFLGAWIGELSSSTRRARGETTRAAVAAVLGHLGGILGKLLVGCVLWVLLIRAAFMT